MGLEQQLFINRPYQYLLALVISRDSKFSSQPQMLVLPHIFIFLNIRLSSANSRARQEVYLSLCVRKMLTLHLHFFSIPPIYTTHLPSSLSRVCIIVVECMELILSRYPTILKNIALKWGFDCSIPSFLWILPHKVEIVLFFTSEVSLLF